jgi:hypothetical protein
MGSTRVSRREVLGGTAGLVVRTGIAYADGSPRPPHLLVAEQLIDHLALPDCPPANNVYKAPAQPNVVTWGRPGEPATWVNQSQCASFLTAVLKRTYPRWATDRFFARNFGSPSPFARDYVRGFASGVIPHFPRVTRVADLRPGDLIAIDYRNDQDTNTGHIVMVRKVKGVHTARGRRLKFRGETQYAVEVADCTAEPHGMHGVGDYASFPDNRIVDGTTEHDGAGYGHMMFYANNTTGAFTRYRWSVNTSSTGTYTITQRPLAAVRVNVGLFG